MGDAGRQSSLLRFWRAATNLGVHAGLSPTDAKYVRLNNALVLVMSAVALLLTPMNLHTTGGLQHWQWSVALIVQAPLFLVSLWLAHKRWTYMATLWFGVVAAVTLIAQTYIVGRAGGIHLFLLLHAVGPFVLVPPRYRKWVFAQSTLYFGCFLFALAGVPDEPLVQIPPATAALIFKVNLTFLFLSLVAFGYYERTNTLLAEAEVEQERQRAETLLLNILPAEIAAKLKLDTAAIADGFAEVTVMFADIAGFTPLASKLQPAQLVAMLNEVFSAFDALAERHGLEKIKTIGDAYMAAAGLPVPRPDHAAAVANMALDMVQAVQDFKTPDGSQLAMRIGIHTGPVVAGVIGRKKFIYDLWGDTVNLAARMESHGEPGQIQVTEATARQLGASFHLEPRGTVSIKGKGEMTTFWLLGRQGQVELGLPGVPKSP